MHLLFLQLAADCALHFKQIKVFSFLRKKNLFSGSVRYYTRTLGFYYAFCHQVCFIRQSEIS